MQDTVDFLKIKIEKAKESLPAETQAAIKAVPWQEVVYDLRIKKGLSLTQTEDLELETELVLCGLVSPANYPSELATRLGLPEREINTIIEEMNERVFKKIREELVKIKSSKLHLEKNKPEKEEPVSVLNPSILDKKLNQVHTSRSVTTEYSIGNISKNPTQDKKNSTWHDPYRINPHE